MRLKQQKGFTLIEIIMAIMVFVVGVVSLFPLISNGLTLLADAKKRIEVASLAREKMNELQALGFNNDFTDITTPNSFSGNPDYKFTIDWEPLLNDSADSDKTVLYSADVKIYWQGKSGAKEDRFVTYVARMNPY